jgi:hypothetical protein
MENIHLLPTEKPSRLFKFANQLHLDTIPKDYYKKYNIYIISDEEIKEDDYYLGDDNHIYCLVTTVNSNGKKIILTTDSDLIADGVQAIEDEFLEWFVENPSCEEVEVADIWKMGIPSTHDSYQLIIPQEEPKQETLEEVAKRIYQKGLQDDIDLSFYDGVRLGANYQAERMYSEEDMKEAFKGGNKTSWIKRNSFEEWFEQFKKKD